MSYSGGKHDRILSIYSKLLNNERVNVKESADRYGVSSKTIHRDIDDIRAFLSDNTIANGAACDIVYNRQQQTYKLNDNGKLKREEVFVLGKILLESRALNHAEFSDVFEKMILCCTSKNDFPLVQKMLSNERFHYIELSHKKHIIRTIWDLGCAVQNCNLIDITYERLTEPRLKTRRIKPVGIMFSDFYFYLAGYIVDKNTANPTIYRIDRIKSYSILKEKFAAPYANRFEEGEFRKRVQFMYGGELLRVEFKYTGESIEAVLDRFPTAQITQKGYGYYIIRAEVFGRGIKPWILSQTDKIEVLKPIELRQEIKQLIEKISVLYS